VVIDEFSRTVVGCSIADQLRAKLVVDALEVALMRRQPTSARLRTLTTARKPTQAPWPGKRCTMSWSKASWPPWRPSCWTAATSGTTAASWPAPSSSTSSACTTSRRPRWGYLSPFDYHQSHRLARLSRG